MIPGIKYCLECVILLKYVTPFKIILTIFLITVKPV